MILAKRNQKRDMEKSGSCFVRGVLFFLIFNSNKLLKVSFKGINKATILIV